MFWRLIRSCWPVLVGSAIQGVVQLQSKTGMQSHNENREDSMLLVSRMQALVRGTLIRRSLKDLRAEFEEINYEIQGGVSNYVPTHWPAKTPCRPAFNSLNKGSDVLQRLAKKGWHKPQPSQQSQHPVSDEGEPIPSQQSEQSRNIEGYDTSQQYSSDFQSRSSLSSSEKSFQLSSVDSFLPSTLDAEGSKPNAHSPSERSIVDNRGANESLHPAKVVNETAENTELLVLGQKVIKKEQHEKIVVSKHFSPENYDTDSELDREGESIHAQTLDERFLSEMNEGSEDKQCATVRSDCSEKTMQRQSLNENDLTLVSSLEESSITLSSPDNEAMLIDTYQQNHQLDHEGAETTSNGQRLPAGQDATSGTDSLLLRPVFSQSCKVQVLHSPTMTNHPPSVRDSSLPDTDHQQSIPGKRDKNEASGSKSMTSEQSLEQTQGAMGVVLDDSIQVSLQSNSHVSDASVAADMTSIWSTDLSDTDDEEPKREGEGKLREMRNNTAMELLWIQQAIESRKNYLRLKSKMTISDKAD